MKNRPENNGKWKFTATGKRWRCEFCEKLAQERKKQRELQTNNVQG
jgi:hypothetical protein